MDMPQKEVFANLFLGVVNAGERLILATGGVANLIQLKTGRLTSFGRSWV
jgi:hypothetical protein